MSSPLVAQPRCPVCWAPTESDRCALACQIEKCDDCRELFAVDEGHDCPPDCDACGERVNPDARCTHGRDLCPECLDRCRDCRADFMDDSSADRWRLM